MGESCITVASKANDKASMALSSLVHALFELESYAVARMILKEGKDPQILLLAPLIEPDVEALIDVQLPFAEDLRVYRFPPLDRVITTSGTTLTKHRNLPTEDLTDAMSDYVDSMDLSTFGRDDEKYDLLTQLEYHVPNTWQSTNRIHANRRHLLPIIPPHQPSNQAACSPTQ